MNMVRLAKLYVNKFPLLHILQFTFYMVNCVCVCNEQCVHNNTYTDTHMHIAVIMFVVIVYERIFNV